MKLTVNMSRALERATKSGAVFAGKGEDAQGRVERHAASTLRALAARGLVELFISPDGGMGARPHPARCSIKVPS